MAGAAAARKKPAAAVGASAAAAARGGVDKDTTDTTGVAPPGGGGLLRRARSRLSFSSLGSSLKGEKGREVVEDAAVSSSSSGSTDGEEAGRGGGSSTAAPSSAASTPPRIQQQQPTTTATAADASTPSTPGSISTSSASSTSSSTAAAAPRTTHLTADALAALALDTPGARAHALRIVEDLAADDRLLQAEALWARLRGALADGGDGIEEEAEEVMACVADPEKAAWLGRLEERAAEARAAMADLEDMSGWAFDHSLLGVDTYRRYEGGLLHIMVNTLIDREKYGGLTCFEPIAILKEADYYHRWSPYCTRNALVRSYDGKGDLLLFLLFSLRVLRREIFLRIHIVDDSLDARRLLIVGHSVPRAAAVAESPGGVLPPQCYEDCPPMFFPSIKALIAQPDERHVRVTIAVRLDFNTSLPRPVVDFAIRRFFQVLIHLIVRAAKATASDPVNNVHAQLIRRDKFYRRFLLPKYLAMCAHHGWAFPGVRALQIEQAEDQAAAAAAAAAAALESSSASDAIGALLASAVLHSGQEEDEHLSAPSSSHGHKSKKKRRRLRPRKHARRLVAALTRVVSSGALRSEGEGEGEGGKAVPVPVAVGVAAMAGGQGQEQELRRRRWGGQEGEEEEEDGARSDEEMEEECSLCVTEPDISGDGDGGGGRLRWGVWVGVASVVVLGAAAAAAIAWLVVAR